MVGVKYRRGVTTYAMGRLKLGPMCTREFRGGKRTEKHDRKRETIHPGSGLSKGDNTPTALLSVYTDGWYNNSDARALWLEADEALSL
jgi:hypothetical protein